jgi:hypothetical protein
MALSFLFIIATPDDLHDTRVLHKVTTQIK